jgi:hypothetical protein
VYLFLLGLGLRLTLNTQSALYHFQNATFRIISLFIKAISQSMNSKMTGMSLNSLVDVQNTRSSATCRNVSWPLRDWLKSDELLMCLVQRSGIIDCLRRVTPESSDCVQAVPFGTFLTFVIQQTPGSSFERCRSPSRLHVMIP